MKNNNIINRFFIKKVSMNIYMPLIDSLSENFFCSNYYLTQ